MDHDRCRPAAMRRLPVLSIILALILALPAVPARCGQGFKTMTWLTEDYYPYNFDDQGRIRGISADLLRLVWKRLGEPELSMELQPWARAYRTALKVPGTVLFGMARTPEREKIFKWAGPIARVRFVLTAPKASGLRIETPRDLEGLGIGTVRQDVADRILDPWRDVCRVEPVTTVGLNLRKLAAGRIDAVAYEERSMRLLLLREGLDPEAYETLFVLSDTPVYYAFHSSTDDALVRRFQNALEDAKASKEYEAILREYTR